MVEQGGLHTIGDVKALVLYILDTASIPLDKEHITEIVLSDGLVDYFDFTQAIQELLQEGLIDILSPDHTNTYVITDVGTQTKNIYEKNLPFNVKKHTLAAITKTMAMMTGSTNIK